MGRRIQRQLTTFSKEIERSLDRGLGRRFLQTIGNFVKDQIIIRRTLTKGPHNGNGERKKPPVSQSYQDYLARYRDALTKAPGAKAPKARSDLYLSGQLFGSLVVKITGKLIKIFPNNKTRFDARTRRATRSSNLDVASGLADQGKQFVPLTPQDRRILQKELVRQFRRIKF